MSRGKFEAIDPEEVRVKLARLAEICSWSAEKRRQYGITEEQFEGIELLYRSLEAGYRELVAEPLVSDEEIQQAIERRVGHERIGPARHGNGGRS